jgi:hypothetical protein
MELAADVADPVDQRSLDVHVDVFKFLLEREVAGGDLLANRFEARDDLVAFVGREHPRLGEHAGVGD